MVDVTGDPIIEVDAGTGIGWNDVANKPANIVSAEYPTGGNTGDVLTKTADGMAWSAGGGGGADVNAVHYTADAVKTAEQKAQARTNIGAASAVHSHAQSDVTGLVDALAGKAASVHTHVQSDVTGLETALAGKQATIADLAGIRSGASAGATAYQKPASGIPKADFASAVQTSLEKADTALQEHQSLAAYRTASAQDAIDATKADIADIPTKTSELTNDSGFLTEHQSLAAYRTAAQQDAIHDATKQDVISDISTIRSGAALGATAVQPETGKGLYPNADATKLAGIEAGADVTDATNVSAAGAVMRSAQASKTASQTAQVGVDANGVLWTAPGGGGGGVDYLTVQNGKICVVYEEASA